MSGRLVGSCVLALILLAACGSGDGSTDTTGFLTDQPPLSGSPTVPETIGPPPALDPATVAAGEVLYGEFCARCHGIDLAGAPDWQMPNEDGSFPPPPQDSTGHTWHHSDDQLVELISDGSIFPQSRMPAFGERLSDAEILEILDFIKSSWGPEERRIQWEQSQRFETLG